MVLFDKYIKNNNNQKYKIIRIKDIKKIEQNIAFIFDGIIDFDNIYSCLRSVWCKGDSFKFYVVENNFSDEIYGIRPYGETFVCILLEDLKPKVVIKDKFRKVYETIVNNDLEKLTIFEQLNIYRKQNSAFYKAMYGRMDVYSRIERFIPEDFEFNDSYYDDMNEVDREINVVNERALKLQYQKSFFDVTFNESSRLFVRNLTRWCESEFLENDYKLNKDIVEVINNKYGNMSTLTKGLLTEDVSINNLNLVFMYIFFYGREVDYVEEDDLDFLIFKNEVDVLSKKIESRYGKFISMFKLKNRGLCIEHYIANFREDTLCLVFEKGILIVFIDLCD